MIPAHLTSSGRVLLSDLDDDEFTRKFTGAVFEPGGPSLRVRDIDGLRRCVIAARRAGLSIVDEEFEAGLVGVAAPVRDFTGTIIAAINVGGPKDRLGKHLDGAGAEVIEAAQSLSERLGFPTSRARGLAPQDFGPGQVLVNSRFTW